MSVMLIGSPIRSLALLDHACPGNDAPGLRAIGMPVTVLDDRLLPGPGFFCLRWVLIWIVLYDASLLSFTPPGLCAGGATASPGPQYAP